MSKILKQNFTHISSQHVCAAQSLWKNLFLFCLREKTQISALLNSIPWHILCLLAGPKTCCFPRNFLWAHRMWSWFRCPGVHPCTFWRCLFFFLVSFLFYFILFNFLPFSFFVFYYPFYIGRVFFFLYLLYLYKI